MCVFVCISHTCRNLNFAKNVTTLLHWANDMKCLINSVKNSSSKKKKKNPYLPTVVAIYTGVVKTFSANVGQILLPSKYAFDLGAKLYRTRWVTINCCRYHTNEDFRSAMFIYCSHWCFIHCHLLITAKLTISCGRITLFSPRVNTPCFCPKVINAGGLSQGGAKHKTRWGTIPNLILKEWHQHLPYFCSARYANITIFFFWPKVVLIGWRYNSY